MGASFFGVAGARWTLPFYRPKASNENHVWTATGWETEIPSRATSQPTTWDLSHNSILERSCISDVIPMKKKISIFTPCVCKHEPSGLHSCAVEDDTTTKISPVPTADCRLPPAACYNDTACLPHDTD